MSRYMENMDARFAEIYGVCKSCKLHDGCDNLFDTDLDNVSMFRVKCCKLGAKVFEDVQNMRIDEMKKALDGQTLSMLDAPMLELRVCMQDKRYVNRVAEKFENLAEDVRNEHWCRVKLKEIIDLWAVKLEENGQIEIAKEVRSFSEKLR